MIVDLHVHTRQGSSDSDLSIPDLVTVATRTGLDGVGLTEHRGPWDRHEFAALRRTHESMFFVNGMEVDSLGFHLLVFGLDRRIGGIHDPAILRRIADAEGAVVILAHPFRYLLSQPANNLLFRGRNPVPQEVAAIVSHPIFEFVDAIEVANGGTSLAENALALAVANALGKSTTGGSDAHSVHGLGRFVTVFEDAIHDADSFMQALRSGRYHAAVRDPNGALLPFTTVAAQA